jgi:peptidyl-prolyl cis-trans isomerase D
LNQKKNQFLVEKANAALQGKNSLEAVASELGLNIREASNINFNSVQVPGIGMEPKVVGTATQMSANQLSKPIAGNNGVYIVEVYDVEEGTGNELESEKMRLAQNLNFGQPHRLTMFTGKKLKLMIRGQNFINKKIFLMKKLPYEKGSFFFA